MGKLGCNIDGNLDDTKFSQPMPWIGLYVAAASLAFLISMAADVIQGIRRQLFWFPCKFSSLNATSLTLLAVATKLSVDLNTSMPRRQDQLAKLSSTILICTVMGNSMPSLGTMENSDMFTNIVALGILVITVIVNVCIQLATGVIYVFWGEHVFIMFIMIVLLLLLSFSALTVPNTKQYLELKYNKRHQLALKEGSNETSKPVVDKLRKDLMKYWVMAHTGSPQFVMARSVTCTASGAFCLLSAATLAQAMLRSHFMPWSFKFCSGESDYHWSTTSVLVTQTIAVGIGTVGPACRWFIAINFSSPKRGNKTSRKSFKVENYWIQTLVEMKECPFTLLGIRKRHCRKLAHDAKDHFLNLCIGVQIGIVLISKGIQFISIFFVSWILSCCNCCKGLLKFRFRNAESASESPPNSKLDLGRFVLHLEGEDAMVGMMMKRSCDPTDYWFRMGEKRRPKYLIKLLERSSQEFKGVVEFDSNQVLSLDSEEPPNCWALPVVTLASIAVVLPNISPKLIEELICSVNEGMIYVRLVENNLDTRKELINIRRAAEGVWVRVELYRKWLDVDLHKLSLQAKSPREALEKLSDTAKNNLVEFHKNHTPQCLKHGPSKWPIKVLAANSMYRITQTMLLNRQSRDDQIGEKLFEAVAAMISDILGACLTNLQRFISAKSLSSSIEEREDSVRHAVHILGKAEKILELQQHRALPGLDPHQMASIDEWRSFYMQKPLPLNPSPSESEAASNSIDLYLTID
ncbi:hypothetical protein I3760_11G149000 [Carya illinoinensis]|uniref:Uncharacterized protein n=1 Tax=Carya illinoinensis TaxID=32201 RepID=A0A8T1NZP6_CARIL|nr:uncharacterized protein LOC122282480 [Carya illinoinensis]KAG2681515.1 hypothetical protein I3760_11G149000 [Carya illinoinensis]KAG6637039.1 hypothetical protein CIPAW_11G152900 [Carya illinoinensis]KAG6688945.1 hypothetical protein I3842_11G151600 [Carya illinoinensis]